MLAVARTVLILITTAILLSADGHESKIPVVSVDVRPQNNEPSAQVLLHAECWASQILAGAGVRLIWHEHANMHPIVIDIATDVPEGFHRGSLAYTQPFEGTRITIFWNRVNRSPNLQTTTALLGHVFAHEIAHLLEGTNRHAKEGIMKANWTTQEIEQMGWTPLSFDPVDIDLIQRGLAARSSATQTGRRLRSRTDH